ncbi:MAG: alpha/beta hydrolase [Chitinophagales bacterium]|nr:alpha/beta hydrolase [Chitinophagales bacterium]
MSFEIILILLIAILIIPILYIFLRPSDIHSLEFVKAKILTPYSHFMNWKGNKIHYTDEGEGETILMIHGLGGSFYNFQGLTNELKDSYRIIRVDLPGMSLSEFKQCSREIDFFEEYTSFFINFFEHLQLGKVHLMGNSLGGMMAWIIAAKLPEHTKSLTLINSAGYEIDKVLIDAAGPIRWPWFAKLLKKGFPRFITNFALSRPFADKSKIDPYELEITYFLINTSSTINTLLSLATCGQAPDTAIIKTINTPTLIIWGQNDIIIPVHHAKKFKEDIPNSYMKIFQKCGHMAMMEYPKEVAQEFKRLNSI